MDAASLVVLLLSLAGAYVSGARQLMADDEGGLHEVDLSREPTAAPSDANVTFKLFTRTNPSVAHILRVNGSCQGPLDARYPTWITAHGWQGAESSFTPTKDAWLATGDYNVIIVDWSTLAADVNYVNVKQHVLPVGELTASLVDWLVETCGFSLAQIALIGHSMGGHVVGVAASSVRSGSVPLVTALDPARPLFEDEVPELRLDASDADVVQVIHTNAGNLGLVEPAGTVDFYPNGGEIMAGCEPDYIGTCSHTRSRQYYTESVGTPDGFVGFLCQNWTLFDDCVGGGAWALMGDAVNRTASGSYYLRTADSPPFALGFDNS